MLGQVWQVMNRSGGIHRRLRVPRPPVSPTIAADVSSAAWPRSGRCCRPHIPPFARVAFTGGSRVAGSGGPDRWCTARTEIH
jgi:hypothetical protein